MAVLASSGVWLLVMMTGAINGYPTLKALDPYRGGYNVDSSSGTGEVPLMGPVKAGSGSSSEDPVYQSAPHEQSEYRLWRAPIRKAPDPYGSTYTAPDPYGSTYTAPDPYGSTYTAPDPYGSTYTAPDPYGSTYTAPVNSQYDDSSPLGSTQSRPQVPPMLQVQPPGPFFHGASSNDPRFASNPKPPGLHHESPPGPFLPGFQPGDLSYEEKTYEHGNYDIDSEEQVPSSQYLPVQTLNRLPISSPLALHALLDRFRLGYPFMNHMLQVRQYPTGTYTLSTDDFEHGRNQWHNSFGAPGGPIKQSDLFRDPRRLKYLRRPVQQLEIQ